MPIFNMLNTFISKKKAKSTHRYFYQAILSWFDQDLSSKRNYVVMCVQHVSKIPTLTLYRKNRM
jgi:hypothetical protein